MAPEALSRWIVDAAIVVVLLEVSVALIRNLRASDRSWHEDLPNLAAGLSLMIGMRIALDGAAWPWLAAALAAAGVAHGVDALHRRRRWL